MGTNKSDSKKKNTLFRKKESGRNVVHKIQRFYLEYKLNKLNQQNLEHRRQFAVFSFDYESTAINIDGVYEVDELEVFFEWLKQLNSDEIFKGGAQNPGLELWRPRYRDSRSDGAISKTLTTVGKASSGARNS